MGMIKSNTQRGECDIFECQCGSHMIRICKDTWSCGDGMHSLEFWEYRGATSWTFWNRVKLGLRILLGKESRHATYDVLINNDEVQELCDSLQKLLLKDKN